jgi:hypothetical protein
MSVTVIPHTFQFVAFHAALIEQITRTLVEALGIEQDVTIEVDETTPLARIRIDVTGDPIVVHAESGAFEDTRRPRQQSENATAATLGRVLLRARDRLVGGFGEAPADDELSLAQTAAWETYCVGRLGRLGISVNQQRWRYNFRNRHGFTDSGDGAFDRLWASDGLTWGELDEISRTAGSVSGGRVHAGPRSRSPLVRARRPGPRRPRLTKPPGEGGRRGRSVGCVDRRGARLLG